MQSIRRVLLLLSGLLALGANGAWGQVPIYSYDVVHVYPHDTGAFTQGLILIGGKLYESTGLYGSSSLREVDLPTGTVLRRRDVPPEYFAEGMTIFEGRLFQLTWQSHVGFIYDPATFTPLGEFTYTGEGWGLTHDDQHLIMSDGTSQIRFLDPVSLTTVRTIGVHDEQGQPVVRLNELEYIDGEIYANIWQTNWIARIDPQTGAVLAWIDLTGLLPAGTPGDVLNGIAFDEQTGHLLVTGKLWPSLFEITLRDTSVTTTPAMTSPSPGTTLTSTTQTFQWTSVAQATRYYLYVGSTPGGSDFADRDLGTSVSATVAGLPTDGRTLYVRVFWERNGAWEWRDFTYTAMTAGGGTSAAATFVGVDATTQGTWMGTFGGDGQARSNETPAYPSYAQVALSGAASWVWASSTADPRALQRVTGGRQAATWYTDTTLTFDINLTDGQTHQVALYAVDWDGLGRVQRYDVLDAGTGAVLDSRTAADFTQGRYFAWHLRGHVQLRVTRTGGLNTVVSGLFFGAGGPAGDPPAAASAEFAGVDATSQGTWMGTFGGDGQARSNESPAYPSYAQVALSGAASWVWASSTTDPRALQRVTGGRQAATWYTDTTLTFDINLTDGQTHQVALYAVDWDGLGRVQRYDVVDAGTGAVLDSRTAADFTQGRYFAWHLRGHVQLRVTRTGGLNTVVSGLFFGAGGPAGDPPAVSSGDFGGTDARAPVR